MNLRQALVDTRQRLERAGIDDASLEAELLLRHVLGIDRTRFYASLDDFFSVPDSEKLARIMGRRLQGEPSAYITGHREFFGLDFIVDNRVLIPRPETELLVETAIDMCRTYRYRNIADIGTGSGVIAISLAVNLPGINAVATDSSQDALEVARTNAARHNVPDRISFVQGDLLTALPAPVDLICSNLPYVATDDLHVGLKYEPVSALDGGHEGLDILERICRIAPHYINPGGGMVLEVGMGQSDVIRGILREVFPTALISIKNDLAGIDRLVTVRLTRNQL